MIGIRMRMPKRCSLCRFAQYVDNSGGWWRCMALDPKERGKDSRVFNDIFDKPKWCPLIESKRKKRWQYIGGYMTICPECGAVGCATRYCAYCGTEITNANNND